jgi:hypothetical protein
MASINQAGFPSGSCSGTCEWVVQGGEWFAVQSTCSTGCSCALSFRDTTDGSVKDVVFGSTTPGDGLPHELFQRFKRNYPDVIKHDRGGVILISCTASQTVIDLF